MKKLAYFVAGGTGGHINAALSVGEEFKSDLEVRYVSGTRYLDYQLFKNKNVLHLDSKPIRTKNPFKLFTGLFKNLIVFLGFFSKLLVERPSFIVGAGGYVCGPTLMAGFILNIPIYIIEQNAVMGVTNKILSKIATKIFVNFKNTRGLEKSSKVVITGNPIRQSIKYQQQNSTDELHILVFGGSLGAKQINEIIWDIVSKGFDYPVSIIHQVGKDGLNKDISVGKNIKYEQLEYIDDMNKAYSWSNIIISRAGASTISELRIVKRPTLLIPFPAATDNHQYYNAMNLKEEGSFYVSVLDQNANHIELRNKILDEIRNLQVNRDLFLPIKLNDDINAAIIIKNEIEKNVWNK